MLADWSAFGSAIIGAIIGGGITGYFALKSTTNAYHFQQKMSEQNENELIQGLLQAFHDEIETVFERYQETMGAKIESLKEGDALQVYYPLISDFFSVYNGNSFLIGRIPENDLRKQIIKTYTLAKGMVDSLRMNNELLQKFEYWYQVFQESKSEVHRNKVDESLYSLREYAKNLKTGHQQIKIETNQLLRLLRKRGVLAEK